MILVDTSVWIDHFRGRAGAELALLLEAGDVLVHPWVVGELALGALGPRRAAILSDIGLLPAAPVLTEADTLRLVAAHRLWGAGIGWVDAQLLGAALLAGAGLWTHDRALARAAARLGVPRFDRPRT